MAEDKRDNPFPFPTATDVSAAPGDRQTKAARNIISRNIPGIPKRGFVLGEADNAPILRGIKDFTTEVYKLVDLIDKLNSIPTTDPVFDDALGKVADQNAEVVVMMEDHRCPDTPPMDTNVG